MITDGWQHCRGLLKGVRKIMGEGGGGARKVLPCLDGGRGGGVAIKIII